MTEAALLARVAAMAATGADYVKVSVGGWREASVLSRAAAAAPGRLIGVFFAEDGPPSNAVTLLAEAGVCGAMIDTRGKDGFRLTDHLAADHLAAFTAACRRRGLLSGLAGSLRVEDIEPLARHAPGYLGFRGGLCVNGDRANALDIQRVRAAAKALRATRRRDAA